MELIEYEVSSGIQFIFKKKAVFVVKNGKPKYEVAELLEVEIVTLYRWLRKKANGESL